LTIADLEAIKSVLKRHFQGQPRFKQACPEPTDIFCRIMGGIRKRKVLIRILCVYVLQKPLAAYSVDFGGKNRALRGKNMLLWYVLADI